MKNATTFILLFRGVGGATQLPTAPLRAALTKAGFMHAATYINSGNALVRSAWPRERTIATVARLCKAQFGFDKPIFAPTAAEWAALIANNPFAKAAFVPKFLHAAVLASAPEPSALRTIRALAAEGEEVKVVKGVCYIHTPSGFGTSKMAARFDKGIGVVNTARNWNSVLKLHALAQAIEGM